MTAKQKASGYVFDNMEGALDQAAFLARVDIPIAVIGPRGTGKFYVASAVHGEFAGNDGRLLAIDCREFRNRSEANTRIREALAQAAGNTLVFKSPHLMNNQSQQRLAKQLSTRRLEGDNPHAVPTGRFIALFPDPLEQLMRSGELAPELASVFAGYPIYVPPIRFRKRAILRWANKILGQESEDRGLSVKGFTTEAERALLQHEWRGNLTEMRQRIASAIGREKNEWIGPVALDLIDEDVQQSNSPSGLGSYLNSLAPVDSDEPMHASGAVDELNLALARAVHACIHGAERLPLGVWLWDEVLLQSIQRYRGELPRAGEFLHTTSRNLSRWLPKIDARASERAASDVWREPQRLVLPWIREIALPEQPMKETVNALLLPHLEHLGRDFPVVERAAIMGVSVPTYQKMVKTLPSENRGELQ
ncbi:MAG: sigma 54-interacting transcriptional regulator [Pseudomonadota bacterium]